MAAFIIVVSIASAEVLDSVAGAVLQPHSSAALSIKSRIKCIGKLSAGKRPRIYSSYLLRGRIRLLLKLDVTPFIQYFAILALVCYLLGR